MALFTKPEDSESGGGPPVSPVLRLDSHRGRCSHVGLPEDHGLGASLTAASLSFIIVILIAHPRYSWPLSSEHEDSVQTCVCVYSGCVDDNSRFRAPAPQRLQYPLIKEYSLNHIRDPYNLRNIP